MEVTVLQAGTIESVVVRVTDQAHELEEIPAGATFSVFDTDGEPITGMQDIPATIDGFDALCLIDTTLFESTGDYELFLYFTSGNEIPILGPHKFSIR